jgi:hypothetical protein
MKYTIIIISIFLLASCSPKVTSSVQKEVRDSIVYRDVPRIVEVQVPGETITLTEYIECDSITNKPKPKRFHAKANKAKVDITIKADGSITATGGCDTLQMMLTVMDREIFRLRRENEEILNTKTQFKTRWFDMMFRWAFGIILALLGLRTFLKWKGLL